MKLFCGNLLTIILYTLFLYYPINGQNKVPKLENIRTILNSDKPVFSIPTILLKRVWEIGGENPGFIFNNITGIDVRSEERRVGKECRSRWSPYH